MSWIRVAVDLPTHPKALRLAEELGQPYAWALMVRLWGWMSQYADRGRIPKELQNIAEASTGFVGTRGDLLAFAAKVGFAEVTPDGDWLAHDWEKFQGNAIRESKRKAAKRQKEWRQRQKAKRNGIVTRDVTHRNADPVTPHNAPTKRDETRRNETRRNGEAKKQKQQPLLADPEPHEILRTAWNELRHPSLPTWLENPPKRKKAAREAFATRPLEGETGWLAVIRRVNASSFCRGETPRGWKANPDWLLRPDTAAKVLEGQFDDGGGAKADARKGYVYPSDEFDLEEFEGTRKPEAKS